LNKGACKARPREKDHVRVHRILKEADRILVGHTGVVTMHPKQMQVIQEAHRTLL